MTSLLTLPETARILGISDSTLRRLLARRELSGAKIGGQWRFTEHDVQEFVQKRRVPAAKVWRENV